MENWLEGKVSPPIEWEEEEGGSNLGSATHLKRTIPRHTNAPTSWIITLLIQCFPLQREGKMVKYGKVHAPPSKAQLPFAKLTIPERKGWGRKREWVAEREARDGSFDPTFPCYFCPQIPPHWLTALQCWPYIFVEGCVSRNLNHETYDHVFLANREHSSSAHHSVDCSNMVDYEAEREKSSSQKSQLTRWIARDSTTMPNGDTWPREKEEIQKLRGGRQGGDVHVLLSKSIIIMISYLNSKILHSFLQNLTSFFFYCIFYAYEKNWTYECGGKGDRACEERSVKTKVASA